MTLSAAGSVYEFAPAAEAVLRPLIDGRSLTAAKLRAITRVLASP
ncbi:hypothetical protein ACFY0F_28895 [Streptomyces sp. NPDC001544]